LFVRVFRLIAGPPPIRLATLASAPMPTSIAPVCISTALSRRRQPSPNTSAAPVSAYVARTQRAMNAPAAVAAQPIDA